MRIFTYLKKCIKVWVLLLVILLLFHSIIVVWTKQKVTGNSLYTSLGLFTFKQMGPKKIKSNNIKISLLIYFSLGSFTLKQMGLTIYKSLFLLYNQIHSCLGYTYDFYQRLRRRWVSPHWVGSVRRVWWQRTRLRKGNIYRSIFFIHLYKKFIILLFAFKIFWGIFFFFVLKGLNRYYVLEFLIQIFN